MISNNYQISRSQVGKQIFQVLPRRLRRRGTSHFPKRLHFGLRKYAQSQEHAKIKLINKRLRHKSLSQEKKYLHSHIWHAKRMKMINIWGYHLVFTFSDIKSNY